MNPEAPLDIRQKRLRRPDIQETSTTVSYYGVRLEKAKNRDSEFVPKIEAHAYTNDPKLQRDIAISFHQGEPFLIKGKTSIVKATIKKMASELGWEVHDVSLKGITKVEDLRDRVEPFKATSDLQPEEGSTRVLLLDEAAPNILSSFDEVLDSLENKKTTKIVALMNPHGGEYKPLDSEQLGRWVYYKVPTDLPKEIFSDHVDSLFGFASGMQEAPQHSFLESRDVALSLEELPAIQGIKEIVEKYKKFHKKANALSLSFTYDDEKEPERVSRFVAAFYNYDINATFQEALEYYYLNKCDSEVDRAKIKGMIRGVKYKKRGVKRKIDDVDRSLLPEEKEELYRTEKEAWRKILGEIEVKPLPDSVTTGVMENSKKLGFALRFVPEIVELGNVGTIQRIGGVKEYLNNLQLKYRNLKTRESLNENEIENHSIPRHLAEFFWEEVHNETINFPEPGQWMAVETVKKPSDGNKYAKTAFAEKLGFEDRFNVSWNELHEVIEAQKDEVLYEIGLSRNSSDIRLLEAIEYNLLANRELWGGTDTSEWTDTRYDNNGESCRIIVGSIDAGDVEFSLPDKKHDDTGFRAVIVFGS
jgi:hypothetical protein